MQDNMLDVTELARLGPFTVRRVSKPSAQQPYAVVRIPSDFYAAIGAPARVVVLLRDRSIVLLPVAESEEIGEKGGIGGGHE